MNWGLLSSEEKSPMLWLQPVFPYFLRTRLADPARAAQKAAIERAFRAHYDGWALVRRLLQSKEPQDSSSALRSWASNMRICLKRLRLSL